MTNIEIPEKQLESYYRKGSVATDKAILQFLKDSRKDDKNPQMVVFGAQALNAYLPKWLDRATKDWDIFITEGDARIQAEKLEKKLDKRYGGDFFSVEPAIHESTFRVRSRVTGDVVADISLKDKTVAFNRIRGVDYAALEYLESEAERLLADPEKVFRRNKDKDTLQRIKIQRIAKKRAQKRKQDWDSDPFPAFRELR